MVGKMTVRERIEMFNNDEMNKIIKIQLRVNVNSQGR